jgi:hypothetical protein
MITDTQIVDAVVAVLPLEPFAILSCLAGAPLPLPIAQLERAAETPVVAPFAAGLLAALLLAIKFVVWGVVFAISIAAVFTLDSVIFMTSLVASLLGRALGLVAP